MAEVMTEKGLSVGVVFNQIANNLITFFTLSLIESLASGTYGKNDVGSGKLFVGCGGITILTALFVFFLVKETKGLSEQEVQNLYSKEDKLERPSYLQLDNNN